VPASSTRASCLRLLFLHGVHEHVRDGCGVPPFCGCDYDRGKNDAYVHEHVHHIFCDHGHDCGPQCTSMNFNLLHK
jgi:hypothetical protein